MERMTPLGALARGLLAGAVGSAAESFFFRATASIAPPTPPGAFVPPEREQEHERATETIARRAVELLAQRGPLDDDARRRAGELVHYGFGAAWGALYGLTAESLPSLRRFGGALEFGAAVWAASDDLLLPAFRLSAWPRAYPLRSHAYLLGTHLVYGAAVWASYRALARRPLATATGIALVAAPLIARWLRPMFARGRDVERPSVH